MQIKKKAMHMSRQVQSTTIQGKGVRGALGEPLGLSVAWFPTDGQGFVRMNGFISAPINQLTCPSFTKHQPHTITLFEFWPRKMNQMLIEESMRIRVKTEENSRFFSREKVCKALCIYYIFP